MPRKIGASAAIEWTLLGLLVAAFVWRGFVPAWQTLNTDFPNYYLAASLLWDGAPMERLYDWIWIQRQKDHAGLDQSVVGFVPLTPYSALVALPLVGLPALAAKRVWLIACLLMLAGTIALLRRITALPARRIALVVFLALIPLRTNFLYGQQHLLMLFLLTLAAWLYLEGREVASGSVLAAAAAVKVYPALFLLYFLRKRAWRALAGLAATGAALGLLGLAVFGVETMRVYVFEITPRVLRAEVNDPYNPAFNSLTALLRRLLVFEPQLNPRPLAHAPAVYAVVQPALQALLLVSGLWLLADARRDRAREALDFGAYVALLFVVSTGSATYHLCALILAPVLVGAYLLRAGQPGRAAAAVALYALACLPLSRLAPAAPGGWRIFLGFPRLYAVLGLWLVVAGVLWRLRSRAGFPRLFVALGVAMALVGALSNLRHMRGQFSTYATRLAAPAPSRIDGAPAAAAGEIFFAHLGDDGYTLARIGRPLDAHRPAGADLFFPAVTPARPHGWVELAAAPASRVVRFPRDATALDALSLPVEIDEAQQPAVSPDGRWLAFIREDRGRGRLWLADLDASPRAERQLVGAPLDVREHGFAPDGRIVLSAFAGGRARLFWLDPRGGGATPIDTADAPAGHPAVAPDGRALAYARRQGGNWQLWVMDLAGGAHRRLTDADCNTLAPAWLPDGRTLVYASDCGRGLGWTALSTLVAR